jgi:pyrimidine-nucleoside phosphorylase
VGNALELLEAIETLQGGGPNDFREHCLDVAGHMLAVGKSAPDEYVGRRMIEQTIQNGRAWEMFRNLVRAQGGDLGYVDDPQRLPKSALVETILAPQSGYLSAIDADEIGYAAVDLGAGRAKKGDPIDHAVGIVIHHNVGDQLQPGEPLFTLHANSSATLDEARQRILAAHHWSDKPVDALPLFYGIVEESDVKDDNASPEVSVI